MDFVFNSMFHPYSKRFTAYDYGMETGDTSTGDTSKKRKMRKERARKLTKINMEKKNKK